MEEINYSTLEIPPVGFKTMFPYDHLAPHIQKWLKREWAKLSPGVKEQVRQKCKYVQKKAITKANQL